MTLHAIATRPHYAAHLQPIVDATPDIGPDVAIVASYHDLVKARRERFRHIVLAQHGIGQSYGGDRRSVRNSGYPGGDDNADVGLFLVPNQRAADRWRARYPSAAVEVIGSPRLDRLPARVAGDGPVVAVSFHWDGLGVPELNSAADVYRTALWDLAARYTVIGHGHPLWRQRERYWHEMGVEFVPAFDDVCRRADVYVCDNSSTLYEFASTDRPVVVLNHPAYRRAVDHGLRFWEAATVGINVDDPRDFVAGVTLALEDRRTVAEQREEALGIVYARRTGAAERASEVLVRWASSLRVAA